MSIRNLMVGLAFALGAMAMITPAHASKSVVVIGDSILAQNVPGGVAKQGALALLTQERDVTVHNLASPGAVLGKQDSNGFYNPTTINMLTQLAGPFNVIDVVIIQAGTNDYGNSTNWGDTYNSSMAIINWARAHGKKVMLLDPIWRNGEDNLNAAGNSLNTYRYFLSLSCKSNADVCWFAHRENTIMGTGAGWQHYDANEVATGTQIHPNVQGHRYLADWIKAEAAAAGFF